MKRGHIYWANLPEPAGRRPVVVLTRDSVIPALDRVVIAPITRTIRGIASEVPVGKREGLATNSVINCDNLATLSMTLFDDTPAGRLGSKKTAELDKALRFALDIVC